MAETKQQKIDILRKEVTKLNGFLEEISRAVSGDDWLPHHEVVERLIQIIQEAREPVKQLAKREGTINTTIVMLEEENSKLWYLVRAFGGDNTLKNKTDEEVNHQNPKRHEDTPFRRPNF